MIIFERFLNPGRKETPRGKEDEIAGKERKYPIPSPEEKILISGEIQGIIPLVGFHGVLWVEIKDDGAGVFKSWGYKEERAAYIADRFLNLDLVPPTVIRDIGGKTGSLQQFISNAQTGFEAVAKETKIPEKELRILAIFDFLIGNTDRHYGNFLIKGAKIFAIDHHLSFAEHPEFFVASIFGEEIPSPIKERILQLAESKESMRFLRLSLEKLLAENLVDLFFKRLGYLARCARRGRFFAKKEYGKIKYV